MIFVDGLDIGDVNDVALRDRRMLSADGIFVVVATISEQTGQSVAEPEVIFRGVPFPDEAEQLLDELRDEIEACLSSGPPRRRSARSTCSRRCSTTTSGSSSTTSSSAGRWCCRSSSRSSRAGAGVRCRRQRRRSKRVPLTVGSDSQLDGAAVRLGDRAHDRQAEAERARRGRPSPRTKRSKTFSRSSAGMPGPSSSTTSRHASPSRCDRRVDARARAACA